ncbi:MAG: DUF4918 family protein [Flavobacteriales bacterium]|jgi:hypothetical protein|nr:DUF4918 family protein [Flavobacteriales bacterium]
MTTLADRLLDLTFSFKPERVRLPLGVSLLDPFVGGHGFEVQRLVTAFHRSYFDDNNPRTLLLGINPGRFGAGLTGIAFTDPNDVREVLGIAHDLPDSRPETSSRFFKQLVLAAGGPHQFYGRAYVHSVFPFGFIAAGKNGNMVNLNYYDRMDLSTAVRPMAAEWLKGLIAAGCRSDHALCLGKRENFRFLVELGLFKRITPLDHPRFIMQYKAKSVERYVASYLDALQDA